jgi:TRAP-type C4-dicarboxylate transport system permease small subunit
MYKLFSRAAALVDWLLKWYIVVLMVLLVILTFVQVVARYLLHSSFTSTPQYARLVVVWLTFMGAAVASRHNRLIRIEIFEERLPPRIRTFMGTFFDLVLMGLLLVIIAKGWIVVIITNSQVVAGTPLSYAAYTFSVVLGSAIMFFYIGLRIWGRFR